MRTFAFTCALLLLVANAAPAGTDLSKAEKKLQKRAVLSSSAPALRKSLCICQDAFLAGYVGRLEYETLEAGGVLMRAQCHILSFEIPSGIAQGGGNICTAFLVVP